eukprot:14801099-Ditylum_brightwellii.AAC.1
MINGPRINLQADVIAVTIKGTSSAACSWTGPRTNAFITMMNALKDQAKVSFLPCCKVTFLFINQDRDECDEENCDEIAFDEMNIQEQTKSLLQSLLCQIGLGFRNNEEKEMLMTCVNLFSNVLCFIINHWKVVFSREYPSMSRMNDSIMALQMLAMVFPE